MYNTAVFSIIQDKICYDVILCIQFDFDNVGLKEVYILMY